MKLFAFLLSALAISSVVFAADNFPVFHKADVVLFQGDSITDGGRARTGSDYNHTMGQDYAYIISARLGVSLAERDITFINRGIAGNKVADLAARWQNDTLNIKPDLISIMIGVNDTTGGVQAEQYGQVYDKLIADTLIALPKVKIILCEPFMLPVGKYKDNFAKIRAELKKHQEVVEKLAVKYGLPIVHFQRAFDEACRKAPPEHWIWDGVHPTYAGHGLMVEEWLHTVDQFWPQGV
ncbi:MAG: SGNH/GDSL hydrolase family protein [Chthoniobacteraceae bacterium]